KLARTCADSPDGAEIPVSQEATISRTRLRAESPASVATPWETVSGPARLRNLHQGVEIKPFEEDDRDLVDRRSCNPRGPGLYHLDLQPTRDPEQASGWDLERHRRPAQATMGPGAGVGRDGQGVFAPRVEHSGAGRRGAGASGPGGIDRGAGRQRTGSLGGRRTPLCGGRGLSGTEGEPELPASAPRAERDREPRPVCP